MGMNISIFIVFYVYRINYIEEMILGYFFFLRNLEGCRRWRYDGGEEETGFVFIVV